MCWIDILPLLLGFDISRGCYRTEEGADDVRKDGNIVAAFRWKELPIGDCVTYLSSQARTALRVPYRAVRDQDTVGFGDEIAAGATPARI